MKSENPEQLKERIQVLENENDRLKEAEGKFKAIFETSPDATFLVNRTTGIIVDANHAAEKLFETKLDNIIGHHQSQLHPTHQNKKG